MFGALTPAFSQWQRELCALSGQAQKNLECTRDDRLPNVNSSRYNRGDVTNPYSWIGLEDITNLEYSFWLACYRLAPDVWLVMSLKAPAPEGAGESENNGGEFSPPFFCTQKVVEALRHICEPFFLLNLFTETYREVLCNIKQLINISAH